MANPVVYTAVDDSSLSGLKQGDYTLSLTDDNGCIMNDTLISVSEPVAITITLDSLSQPSDCITDDGYISVTATGGGGDANPPNTYTYSWTDLGAGPGVYRIMYALLDNIGAGLYEVAVTDDSLCAGSKANLILVILMLQ